MEPSVGYRMNRVKRLVKGGDRCRLTGAVWPRGPPAGAHIVPEEPAASKA